jgi:hypothetical protein
LQSPTTRELTTRSFRLGDFVEERNWAAIRRRVVQVAIVNVNIAQKKIASCRVPVPAEHAVNCFRKLSTGSTIDAKCLDKPGYSAGQKPRHVVAELRHQEAIDENERDGVHTKLAGIIHKDVSYNPTLVRAETVLELVAINGAKALGLEESIGSLEVGKKGRLCGS